MSSGRLKCKSLTISQEESLIRSPRVPKRLPLSNLKTKESLVSSTRLYFNHRNWYICLSKRWSHHLFLAVGSRGILKELSITLFNLKRETGSVSMDFQVAFYLLCLKWEIRVLERNGLDAVNICRIKAIYHNWVLILVINNATGAKVKSTRMTLRQGDLSVLNLVHILDRSSSSISQYKIRWISIHTASVLVPLKGVSPKDFYF